MDDFDPFYNVLMRQLLAAQGVGRQPAEEEPQEAFKTGHRVILHGLTRADLNGRYAFVLDPVAKGGRYHLRMQDTKADIRAKSQNFTKIVAAPTEVVDIEAQENSVDTSTLLHGDCCICLQAKATHAVVPCGHLALCDECAPEVRSKRSTCPICRCQIHSYLRVFVPGGSKEEELEKAIGRCREAETRARDLKAEMQKPPKRRKLPTSIKRTPEKGFWVKMPSHKASLSALQALPPELAQRCGEIVSVTTSKCVVRFTSADADTYTRQGRIKPGDFEDFELPIDFPFLATLTAAEAKECISGHGRCCVFAPMKAARKKKIQSKLPGE